ncbi:neutral zinc metallopeptidase [Nonomuraea sp. NPDC050556]|uniref:neutral zinc metallopeptidase n=1 Tax=Nonomuraea sp. NPDC050556 TaxID=3364369 RepID=UPI0037BA35BB
MSPKALWVLVFVVLAGCTATPPPATPKAAPPTTPAPSASPTTPVKPILRLRPSGNEARDHNPLNLVGKAGKTKCRAAAPRTGSYASWKRYLTTISGCLDRFWAREFAEARLRFDPPRRSFPKKAPKSFCKDKWTKGAAGTYCGDSNALDDRRFVIPIPPYARHANYRMEMAVVVAHEYGHHIQEMSGYTSVADSAYERTSKHKAIDLITRRSELQTDCFAGIAIGAFYDSLFHSRHLWPVYRWNRERWYQDKGWDLTHGRLMTQRTWLDRGFKARQTGACNTWRYPAGSVK